ncbi:hypothetical protein HK096_010575, partial [Nowakowskiella sp. JEL0078]
MMDCKCSNGMQQECTAITLECAMNRQHISTAPSVLRLLADISAFLISKSWGIPKPQKFALFGDFVMDLISDTNIPVPIVIVALWLLERLRIKYSVVNTGDGAEFRLITTSLMIANK